MLSIVQILEFELGTGCNLAALHPRCPNRHPDRYAAVDCSRALDDGAIVEAILTAYRDFGFAGLVGWIYYNEPLLEMERMFSLMERVWRNAPFARFMLWTNGTLLPQDCGRFARFEQIYVSQYDEGPAIDGQLRNLLKVAPWARVLAHRKLDGRLEEKRPQDPAAPCRRPHCELIFDAYGNAHLCCFDWRGLASPGNLLRDGLAHVLHRWRTMLPSIGGGQMLPSAPAACRRCGHRVDGHQLHEMAAIVRAEVWRDQLVDSKGPR